LGEEMEKKKKKKKKKKLFQKVLKASRKNPVLDEKDIILK